ncbi:ATP-dependent DNA helicase PIF7-like protein [Tanacetum coccineum]
MSHHKKIYVNPSHTKKIFANMRREGKDFSRRVTPLFETMMVQPTQDEGVDSGIPTDSNQTPITTQPSTSISQKKQSRRNRGRTLQLLRRSHNKMTVFLHLPMIHLLVVLDLEKAKESRYVGMFRRAESSEDKDSLGDHKDASKQGMSIKDIDKDTDVSFDQLLKLKIQKMNIKFRGGLLGLKRLQGFLELLLHSTAGTKSYAAGFTTAKDTTIKRIKDVFKRDKDCLKNRILVKIILRYFCTSLCFSINPKKLKSHSFGTHATEVTKSSQPSSLLFLDQLDVDVSGTIVVMIDRMWDVSAITGHYLSTDFVVSDSKANIIHCTAKGTVAHNFLHLKEGGIYSIKNFIVHPNKDDFRIMKHATFMLEFDGATAIRKVVVSDIGFLRYPFQLVDFDLIEATNNKYLNDVTDFVTNVGRTTYQKSGSRTLDFYLANHRGQANRVTLWGGVGDVLIEKKTNHAGMCAVVLTLMFVKNYNNKLYLSSSSSTAIYDDGSIPTLQELKSQGSVGESNKVVVPVEFSEPKEGSLENVLMWARNRKNDLPVNLESGFAKHATRQLSTPVIRYKLELGVADDTTHVVVVLFDEPTTELLKCSVESLLASVDESIDEDSNFLVAITNLIGTTHVFGLKSHTYYEYGTFESFTCWKINPSAMVVEVASSTIVDENTENPSPEFKSLARTPFVCTPSKGPEENKKKRSGVEEFDADDNCGSSKKPAECNVDAGTKKKKQKSLRSFIHLHAPAMLKGTME